MSPNPITYLDIEAYERRALIRFSAWETDLLVRMDQAALSTVVKARPKPKNGVTDHHIPVENAKGLKSMFRGLSARFNPKVEGRRRQRRPL